MNFRDMAKECKHTIYYYIGGDLCIGTVSDEYIAESEKLKICNIFGYSKSYKAQAYLHPTDGRFFIPV